jgi:8-oxo-dGTP pyrophosphatase MutT (NUDIX family)
MSLQQPVELDELNAIERRFGLVRVERATLTVVDPFLTGEHQMLTSDGRRAEICYVMHRGNPAAGVLLHIKRYYPDGAFRLPTGGIHVGEAVIDTLSREIYEETGLTVGDAAQHVAVERCLGVLDYDLQHATLGPVRFATYHFLVRMPPDGILDPQDEDEAIAGWQWLPAGELAAVAAILEAVPQRSRVWGDWGRYRALSHRFVAAALH